MKQLLCALVLATSSAYAGPEDCIRLLTDVTAEPMGDVSPPLDFLTITVTTSVPFADHETYFRWTFLPFGTEVVAELGIMGTGPSHFVDEYFERKLSLSDDGLVRWQEERGAHTKLLKTWMFEINGEKARALIAYAYAYAKTDPARSLRVLDFLARELKGLPIGAIWPIDRTRTPFVIEAGLDQ